MRTKIQELKNSGLSVVNLYNYWLARRLVPFRCRCHYMWEYTGQNDCTLDLAMEWAEADYRKALAKITMAPFTFFDAEMQLFSAEKPAPEVRTSTRFPYASSAVLFCMLVTWPLECRRGTRSPTIFPHSLGRSPRR
jgi:hypothetical protein